jgi:hypothetical protein
LTCFLQALVITEAEALFANAFVHYCLVDDNFSQYVVCTASLMQANPRMLLLFPFCLQANFVLPWRWALVIQLVNSAAVLGVWSRQLPCWLQAVQLQPNNATELFYQAQATHACIALQYMSCFMRMGLGDVTYLLLDRRVCEGLRAVQVLQVFAAIVCLSVLPLAVFYAIERRYKLQFLRSLAQADAAAAAAAVGSTSNDGSNLRPAAAAVSNRSSDSYTAGLLDEPVAAVMLRWLVCVAAMLMGSWLLAEVLVMDVFDSTAACLASS